MTPCLVRNSLRVERSCCLRLQDRLAKRNECCVDAHTGDITCRDYVILDDNYVTGFSDAVCLFVYGRHCFVFADVNTTFLLKRITVSFVATAHAPQHKKSHSKGGVNQRNTGIIHESRFSARNIRALC
jgi:hypothetical protein